MTVIPIKSGGTTQRITAIYDHYRKLQVIVGIDSKGLWFRIAKDDTPHLWTPVRYSMPKTDEYWGLCRPVLIPRPKGIYCVAAIERIGKPPGIKIFKVPTDPKTAIQLLTLGEFIDPNVEGTIISIFVTPANNSLIGGVIVEVLSSKNRTFYFGNSPDNTYPTQIMTEWDNWGLGKPQSKPTLIKGFTTYFFFMYTPDGKLKYCWSYKNELKWSKWYYCTPPVNANTVVGGSSTVGYQPKIGILTTISRSDNTLYYTLQPSPNEYFPTNPTWYKIKGTNTGLAPVIIKEPTSSPHILVVSEDQKKLFYGKINTAKKADVILQPVPFDTQGYVNPYYAMYSPSTNKYGVFASSKPSELNLHLIDQSPPSADQSNWMSRLSNTLNIGDINIPGSHDSAAIYDLSKIRYGNIWCQYLSISEQLQKGIRLLDIRLKVTKPSVSYVLMTCHDKLLNNEFQSFVSVLEECTSFLRANSSETILMSIKFDNWNGFESDKNTVYKLLKTLLNQYPTKNGPDLPLLSYIRGNIFIFIREKTGGVQLGTPLSIPDNTPGELKPPEPGRNYSIFVQDKYKELSIPPYEEKLQLVTNAFAQKNSAPVVYNYASGTSLKILKFNINGDILDFFGKNVAANRPKNFGWTLFDYPENEVLMDNGTNMSVIDLIVASNFGYQGYEKTFATMKYKDEL